MIIGMIIIIITMIIIVIIIIIISISIKPKSINLKPTSILLKRAHLHQAQNQQQEHLSLRPSFPSLLFFFISFHLGLGFITKLGLVPQLKPKPKLHLLHSSSYRLEVNLTTPPLRQQWREELRRRYLLLFQQIRILFFS